MTLMVVAQSEQWKMGGFEIKGQVEEMTFVKKYEEMARTWATNSVMTKIITLEMAEIIFALLKMEWPVMGEMLLTMMFVLKTVEMEGTLVSYHEMMEIQETETDVLPLVI